jgi:O-antigen ligase
MLTTHPEYRWYRDSIYIARSLIIANLIFLLFSPPLTNVAEGVLYLMVLTIPRVRRQVLSGLSQPMAAMCLLFGLSIIVASFYGPAPRAEAISMMTGWRRLLLLPIAVGLFNEDVWKNRTLWILIIVLDVCAVVSYGFFFAHYKLPQYGPYVTVRNYVTQSMTFSVAAFSAAMLLRQPNAYSTKIRLFLIGSIALLAVNALTLMTGRSGYIVLGICGAAYAFSYVHGKKFDLKHLLVIALPVVIVCAAIAALPTARHRVERAVHEGETYQTADKLSSIGIRLVFLKNTLKIIEHHRIFGVGTGGFKTAYAAEVGNEAGWEATITTDPHNQFLKTFAEQGIIGFAIFIAFIASAFRQKVAEPYRILGLGVLCAWCGTSLFNSHFSTFSEGRFIFVWCGVMLAASATKIPGATRNGSTATP